MGTYREPGMGEFPDWQLPGPAPTHFPFQLTLESCIFRIFTSALEYWLCHLTQTVHKLLGSGHSTFQQASIQKTRNLKVHALHKAYILVLARQIEDKQIVKT